MYEFNVRPDFGRELAAQPLKQHKFNSFKDSSSKPAGHFLLSSLYKNRRVAHVPLTLLVGCVISILAGCGGVTHISSTLALSTISCGTQALTGAQSTACSVNLSDLTKSSTAVTLTSSNTALHVPTTVVVAAGAKTAEFNAVSEAVSKSVTVTITAAAGSVAKTDVITLNPAAAPAPGPTPGPVATLSKVSCATKTLTGPTTVACAVYLSAATTSQTTVALSTSGSALQTPTSVNVPAGETSAGFNITAAAVNKSQTATLTATADGVSQMDALTLSPAVTSTPSPVATLSKLSCASKTLTVPATTACSVYLSAAANSQTIVKLSSSISSLKAPVSVNVAAGATSAAFNVTASTLSTKQTALLTATVNGVSQMDSITLNPATTASPTNGVTLSRLSCATQTLTGPTWTECSVYLSAPVTSQTVVMLSSNNKALQTPASVNVATGATSAAFKVTASALSSAQPVTLTATANGVSQTDVIQLEGGSTEPTTQHTVQLNWNAPAATADPVVGYHVYRASSGGSNFVLLSPSSDTQTNYDDTTVKSGDKYDYIVRSVDSDGAESAPSNKTTVTVP
jgi:hypothetical protein